ncbi:MAG: PIN domain-containing protein [Phycisphaerae bacterium]
MTPCFADTSYYLAVINPDDANHSRAAAVSKQLERRVVTTAWVLLELADGLAGVKSRRLAISLVQELSQDPFTEILCTDQNWFDVGFALYQSRLDKAWSLTDCISFEVMRRRKIEDALTADHHFKQAGFRILL